MSSVNQVISAFHLLYEGLRDPDFRKSLPLDRWPEKKLLPLVRTFLLGYFGSRARPEIQTPLPGGLSGFGRVDFVVYGIAVELAVRPPGCPKALLLPRINRTEVIKLMKHCDRAVLILFDFAHDPLGRSDLEAYRDLPTMGRGNHQRSPFSVAYFSLGESPTRLNVRV